MSTTNKPTSSVKKQKPNSDFSREDAEFYELLVAAAYAGTIERIISERLEKPFSTVDHKIMKLLQGLV